MKRFYLGFATGVFIGVILANSGLEWEPFVVVVSLIPIFAGAWIWAKEMRED